MSQAPIKGMTKMPALTEIDGGAAFVSCVLWAAGNSEAVAQFRADTGIDLYQTVGASGINRLIDEASGAQGEVVAKFADWVAEKIWGLEEADRG